MVRQYHQGERLRVALYLSGDPSSPILELTFATGANTLLAYFHYCNKGVYPFSEECRDSDLQTLAELNDSAIQFVQYTRNYSNEHSKPIPTPCLLSLEVRTRAGNATEPLEAANITSPPKQSESGKIFGWARSLKTIITLSVNSLNRIGNPERQCKRLNWVEISRSAWCNLG